MKAADEGGPSLPDQLRDHGGCDLIIALRVRRHFAPLLH